MRHGVSGGDQRKSRPEFATGESRLETLALVHARTQDHNALQRPELGYHEPRQNARLLWKTTKGKRACIPGRIYCAVPIEAWYVCNGATLARPSNSALTAFQSLIAGWSILTSREAGINKSAVSKYRPSASTYLPLLRSGGHPKSRVEPRLTKIVVDIPIGSL